ncbi:MAG: hypothetical protein PHP53_12785 [Prolixibacteraceae bacterium]|nr:hypothetical protein [Prolixibacteraceae bacterium]
MIAEHLSENELQQYVSDSLHCEQSIREHIKSCYICKEKAETYQILFSGIQRQQKPEFDFNLTDLVIAQLEQPKRSFSTNIVVAYLLSSIGITAVLISCFLFHEYLSGLFIRYSNLLIYLFMAITAVVFLFQCIEICRKYKKQIGVLNLS